MCEGVVTSRMGHTSPTIVHGIVKVVCVDLFIYALNYACWSIETRPLITRTKPLLLLVCPSNAAMWVVGSIRLCAISGQHALQDKVRIFSWVTWSDVCQGATAVAVFCCGTPLTSITLRFCEDTLCVIILKHMHRHHPKPAYWTQHSVLKLQRCIGSMAVVAFT